MVAWAMAPLALSARAGDSIVPMVDLPDAWPGMAGGPSRPGTVSVPPPLDTVRAWTATTDETGATITYLPQAGVAVSNATLGHRVFALGRVSRPGGPVGQARLFAFSRDTGICDWSVEIATPTNDSIASPTIDHPRGTVIVASGTWVVALDACDGEEVWKTALDRTIVNTSPAATTDLPGRNRLFITDYDGFGAAASLYCINIDPFDADINPFSPGDIVWQVPIGGSSGNSPAYLPRDQGGLGLVYVASVGEFGFVPGRVWAFPADAVLAPDPAWTFDNTMLAGFFGGVGLVRPQAESEAPAVLAASYVFSGGLHSANLVKLDGADGTLRWSVPANRTVAVPLSLPGGRILLSGGIQGFGTVPSLRLYQDLGDNAVTLWDSAIHSWTDADADGQLDPGEYFRVGGWTQQPALLPFGGRSMIASGVIPATQFNQPSADFYYIDADAAPASGSFVVGHHAGAGGSPAQAGQATLSVGSAGLVALGPTPARLDVDDDDARTVDDLYAWEAALGERDVNGDGTADALDRRCLLVQLHLAALRNLRAGGRP